MNLINTKITNPVQLLGFVIQVLNANVVFFGPDAQMWIAIGVAGLQSVVGILQARRNPDGTSARLPWNPVNPPPAPGRPLQE